MNAADFITDVRQLKSILHIGIGDEDPAVPLLVPRSFVNRMETGNPGDPLLLQILPTDNERRSAEGFRADPLNETVYGKNGVLQKYPRRILMLVTRQCGVHCRFCFRQHCHSGFPFPELQEIGTAAEEIILSGGDPLMLEDEALDGLCQRIVRLPNIKRLRIHSRLPVVLPQRMTPQLNKILTLPIPVYLVLHINHPNEINDELIEYRRGVTAPFFLSQTVLLRGINDTADTLDKLFTALVNIGIIPYYLHQLDKVQGAAHFEVPPEQGCRIVEELRSRLSGYAVPRYVRETAGLPCKETLC